VKAHLNLFVEAYRRRGEVPAVVFEHGTLTLIVASLRMLVKPSLLRAYPLSFALPNLFGRGLQTWTGDSAILLLIGLHEYSEASSDQSMLENFKEEALGLLQGLLKMAGQEGLLTGSGWMDAMANYVGQPNLVLQILFYKALRLYGFKAEAEGLKEQIQEAYWRGDEGFYSDLPGGNRLDVLGNAMAILYELASPSQVNLIVEAFNRASTPHGVLNLHPPYSKRECSQRPHVYHNSTIWPMVQGFVAKALLKAGYRGRAKAEYERMVRLPGVYEWYTPEGKPRGSPNQLWSAAKMIEACKFLREN